METRRASRVPTIALALPWLDDDLQAARAVGNPGLAPVLAWLLERSSASRVESLDWRAWLLGHVPGGPELLHRHPPGPIRRTLARKSVIASETMREHGLDAATWACAQPVHLATGIDHLSLEPSPADPLTPQETGDIVASLNTALAGRGWSLVALDAGRWLLACEQAIECESSPPADAAGRELRSHLPEGRDARLVRTVMNEMQMILHAHAVNERRAARGQQPVNAVWLWGFGPEREVDALSLPRLATDDEWLRELWRLHAQDAVDTSASALDFTSEADLLVAASLPDADRVRRATAEIFASLKAALESRGPRSVELFSGRAVHRFESMGRRSVLGRWLSLVRGSR